MKKTIFAILAGAALAGAAQAGVSLGMTGAFKKQAARLDDKVLAYRAANSADIAVYRGAGAWSDGITAFEKFLDSQGITWKEIDQSIVNKKDLRTLYKGIYISGGYAYYYKTAFTSSGNQHIRELVSGGGAYIGSCAGAYYAADKVVWQGPTYDYPLKLFSGSATGAIDAIIPWDGYKMTGIDINQSNPVNGVQSSSYTMVYYGGPYFTPAASQPVETLATYRISGEKAAINFEYGAGRVLLLGPHPEILVNSDSDGTTWGSTLTDPETDWPFLAASVRWALKMSPP